MFHRNVLWVYASVNISLSEYLCYGSGELSTVCCKAYVQHVYLGDI